MAEKLHLDISTLRALHRFGDAYEEAIAGACSDAVELTPDRASRDCIGRHWYGMRCRVVCKTSGRQFYLHTGLIFLPETRTGLMVEVDKANNTAPYDQVWAQLESAPLFEVNRDEPIYLKLFMPDADFTAMQTQDYKAQVETLRAYFVACAEAIAAAAQTEGFRLCYDDLANTLRLAHAFEAALGAQCSPQYTVESNAADPDNFGQYASGYRYWLRDAASENEMYAYFGGIYSYKKEPAGIFAEIDWLNNQAVFARAFSNMKSGSSFTFSDKEEKFIKLFMRPETAQRLNDAQPKEQREILNEFLAECNHALVLAARGE